MFVRAFPQRCHCQTQGIMKGAQMLNNLSKAVALLGTTAFFLASSALCQQTDLLGSTMGVSTNRSGDSTLERPITPSTLVPPEPIETRAAVGGALPAVFRSPNPLQMINPFAPREYGDGTQFISTNLITGHAEGVTLLSLKLPTKFLKPKKPSREPTKTKR